jgi:hypothetical protein
MMAKKTAVDEKPATVPVAFQAMVRRVNRALAKQGLKLRRIRADIAGREFTGEWVVTPLRKADHKPGSVRTHVDVEKLAREELGALEPWESVLPEG